MSTIRLNRAQSAYNPSVRRSATTVERRPDTKCYATTMNKYESQATVLNVPAWRRVNQTSTVGSQRSWQRPKTSSFSTVTSSQIETSPTEIEHLLRCLDRTDKRIVHVKCLAEYRTLSEAIDLQTTPFDRKSLCALQQRENRIIQRNACRDRRFHSLLNILTPSCIVGMKEDLNNINLSSISENPPKNILVDNIKNI